MHGLGEYSAYRLQAQGSIWPETDDPPPKEVFYFRKPAYRTLFPVIATLFNVTYGTYVCVQQFPPPCISAPPFTILSTHQSSFPIYHSHHHHLSLTPSQEQHHKTDQTKLCTPRCSPSSPPISNPPTSCPPRPHRQLCAQGPSLTVPI